MATQSAKAHAGSQKSYLRSNTWQSSDCRHQVCRGFLYRQFRHAFGRCPLSGRYPEMERFSSLVCAARPDLPTVPIRSAMAASYTSGVSSSPCWSLRWVPECPSMMASSIFLIRSPLKTPSSTMLFLALPCCSREPPGALALKEFRTVKGDLGYVEAVRISEDPSVFTVLFEDTAALLGLVIALVGISAAQLFNIPELDGVAAIGISIILGGTAIFLARESKGLADGRGCSSQRWISKSSTLPTRTRRFNAPMGC